MQDVYELDIAHDVYDYLITDPEFITGLGFNLSRKNTKEQLLVYQDQDDLMLSLYLHDTVVENLQSGNDNVQLGHNNLEDFCMALEGISHFLYVIWNATYERSITRLEMELQADIDKFIVLSAYMGQQFQQLRPGQLRRLLFESISYHDDLSEDELQRYRDANNYAEKYCWYLESRFQLQSGSRQELLNELRRFYRLNLGDKLRRINYLH